MSSSNVHFGELSTDITLGIRNNNLDYQERIKQIDLGKMTAKTLDSFEKSEEIMETLCGCYPNYQVVKGMPQSIFADQFGYDMQKSIYNCMTDYYAGKICQSEVKDFFEECCTSMRIFRTQQCQTSGNNATDNQQIVSQMYEIFAKQNAIAAQNANYQEGLAVNQTYGGRSDNWVYYNSDYYYQCEETKGLLQEAVGDMADKWEIPSIDTEEVEKKSKYIIDGGFDFNSGWNCSYRNQVGRGSMEDESLTPPENFQFFYKQNSFPDNGTLWVSLNGQRKNMDVPFSISQTGSLKGQIYSIYDLLDNTFKAENDNKKYSRFLSGFTVFTRQYSLLSGINNRFGNYTPRTV